MRLVWMYDCSCPFLPACLFNLAEPCLAVMHYADTSTPQGRAMTSGVDTPKAAVIHTGGKLAQDKRKSNDCVANTLAIEGLVEVRYPITVGLSFKQ